MGRVVFIVTAHARTAFKDRSHGRKSACGRGGKAPDHLPQPALPEGVCAGERLADLL